MKKTLIAGAASFALAAMPVIGVFAVDPPAVVDTLTVTVNESCNFTHTSGNGQFTKTMGAGLLDSAFGTSSFTASCNNGAGYTISAEFTTLANTDDATKSPIAYSETTPTAGSGTWTANNGEVNIGATGGVLGSRDTQDPAGGSTYSVTYAVSTHSDQAQGTYTGTATYTLTQN